MRNPIECYRKLKQKEIIPCDNQFGFITPKVPIAGIKDPIQRLLIIRDELNKGKRGVESMVSSFVGWTLAIFPKWFVRRAFQFLTTGITLTITNVKGFPGQLRMHGMDLVRMLGFVPGPCNCEITALIISYNNCLNLCLNCNASTIDNPRLLIKDVMQEYKDLRDAALKSASSSS
ncbi:hypothetical protein AKO1_008015 [Acrasis kona]|uniref:O-acyltransferase WSD1 C-terminal domain-containing protein n=1 Tax=Acrasis kona TaxID=1008807 RepID=A0AAW2YR71_9EUKA